MKGVLISFMGAVLLFYSNIFVQPVPVYENRVYKVDYEWWPGGQTQLREVRFKWAGNVSIDFADLLKSLNLNVSSIPYFVQAQPLELEVILSSTPSDHMTNETTTTTYHETSLAHKTTLIVVGGTTLLLGGIIELIDTLTRRVELELGIPSGGKNKNV